MPDTNRHRNSNTHNHQHATVNHHPPPKRNHPKFLSIFLKFIVMSLIISIFLIFIGLAAILVLHVLLAGSFLHRRRRQDTTHQPPTTSAYSLLDLQNHLPCFQYSGDSSGNCSICLDCFKEEELCRALPVCSHLFHAQCVDSWLTKVPNCPVCRTPVRLEVDRSSDLMVGDEDWKFLWAIGVGRQVVVDY